MLIAALLSPFDVDCVAADALADRPTLPTMQLFLKGKYGLIMADGAHWREQRRFTLHVLRDFGFGEASITMRLAYALHAAQDATLWRRK